ncbi:MAG: DUF4013 domain-containing protein [Lentimonas sp.]
MPIFEEGVMRLIRQPGFWLKLLIGGLLSFIPVVNFFAFGYLYRFSRAIRNSGQVTLLAWDDWQGLFMDGLRFAVVWHCYWLLPILLMAGLSWLLSAIGLGAVAYITLSVTFLISSILFCSALYRLQMCSDFKELLDVPLIVRMTYLGMPRFIIPAFVFLGVFAFSIPFYGFAVFFGFLMLIAHTSLCFRAIERARPSLL